MKKEISCSNTFLPYVSDKTKKNGKIFVYYLNRYTLILIINSLHLFIYLHNNSVCKINSLYLPLYVL